MPSYTVDDIPLVVKKIADNGRTVITEAETTALIGAYAKHVYPNDRPATAFAKVFEAKDAFGVACRKAVAIAKGLALILPLQIGGQAAIDAADDDPADALEQLQALAEEQHRRQPALSKAQAFAKVFTDPANRHLAAAERRQARARMA
jgi:hypothetical protein